MDTISTLSVITCANVATTEDEVVDVAESALSQSPAGVDVEVVIVVSGSDSLYSVVADRYDGVPNVFVVEQPTDGGVSAARNRGADVASGDVYAFVDSDVTLGDGWAEELLRPYDEHGALAVGGPAYPDWDDPTLARRLPDEMHWLVGCTERGFDDRVTIDGQGVPRTRNTYACNLSFRADVFDELGGFDTSFGKHNDLHQGEETEFCYRFQITHGEQIVYAADAEVEHTVYADQLEVSYLLKRAWWQGVAKAEMKDAYPNLLDEEIGFLRVIASGIGRETAGIVRQPSSSQLTRPLLLVALTVVTGLGYLYETLNT